MFRTSRPNRNLAARMGRWSAAHWKTATFGWLAFVIVAVAVGMAVGQKSMNMQDSDVGQARKADRILEQAGFQPAPQTEIVLIQSKRLTIRDAAFRSTVEDVVRTVRPFRTIANLRSPLDPSNADQISQDGRTAIVQFTMKGDSDVAQKNVDALIAATGRVAKAHPAFYVGEAGWASSAKAFDKLFGDQLKQAGERSVPLTLAVLIIVFGALVAAGLPLLLALTAVGATIGLIALPSQLVPMDKNISAVVLLVGLAVGVDYALFYLKREREERAAGKGPRAALEAAAATSGRAVLISGVTVMVAMAGLLFARNDTYLGFGIATMLVVAVAMVGSLTVLPALLSRLGDRVEKGRIPFLSRLRRPNGENRFWSAILTPALRHPLASALLATAVLLVLAFPVLDMHTAQTGLSSAPKGAATVETINRIQAAFPGGADPAIVAIKAKADSPVTRRAVGELRTRALASGQMRGPIVVDVNPGRTVTRVAIPLVGDGTDARSRSALRTLRDELLPATVGKVPDATYAVTGGTAQSVDQNNQLKSAAPFVFGFVLTFAFLLLLVSFRSIVIPLKAIALNLLSVGAGYGVLVAVFQYGWGESLLDFQSNGGIAYWLPIFMFVILFGLSMDYNVFILSRVREAFDRGLKTEDAVANGIKTTAGVVTSAAVVMVGVFAIFITLPILDMKEMGVGLAVAVLVDATIVRAVLLPATMKLLGDWNWYLPKWLEWLPRIQQYEPEPTPEPEPEVKPARRRAGRALTPGRIVGLVLIGLLVLGLGYLRFSPGAGAVSVPAGAKAGDLTLKACSYETEKGSYDADCGTLVVPENRADPQSRLIAVPVKLIRARSAHPGAPIFRLEGGPGITNMKFKKASRFAENHDVVLVGYRGVDGSVRLDCPEVESALSHSTDYLADKSFDAYADAFRACADRLTADGVYLGGYGLVQQADDLEAARKALGYDRIDLLSESTGTRTAMIYAWRYPRRVHRSVMIGVNPPGHFLWDAKTTDEQIGRYSALCAKNHSCSNRTDDLAATIRRTAVPDRWFFLPIKQANVRLTSFFGLMETTPENAPADGPMTMDAWLAAADGDASGFWLQSVLADLLFPKAFVWGQYAAAGRLDAQAARDYFSGGWDRRSLGSAASAFIWGGGRLADAWPAAPDENEYSRVRRSNVKTLLVGGGLDFSTPPQNATKELLPYLPNGRQVVLPGFGHSTSFWSDQSKAGTHLINTFFDTGRVDTSLYKPQKVDFTPEVTQPALAKGIAGTMVGLAFLVVLSLPLMARRVRKRGRFGAKASASVRSLYAVVLGLGGWFLGLLIVLMALPGVPLDSVLLATLSIGVPIGLAVYFAWVNRDWSAKTKAAGFAAAVGGALAGAWLGFNAVEGLLALVTSIVGAVAVGNLILLALDIAWDRQLRDRFAETKAKERVEARPSIG
jgi:RND superfamily putative drug exporter